MKKIIFIMAALLSILFNTAYAASGPMDYGFDGKYIEADGWGDMSYGDSLSLVREAAIMDAERNLLGYIHMRLESETITEKHRLTSDTIERRISGVIRHAEVISERQEGDHYIVRMRIPVYGNEQQDNIAKIAFGDPWVQKPFPTSAVQVPQPEIKPDKPIPPSAQPTTSVPSTSQKTIGYSYTGLIVDCRGLTISTAMSPVIRDEGHRSIYGHENLNYDFVVETGMAGYSHGESNLSRAGSNPLRVKAISIDGYFYPVVSKYDADLILSSNQSTHYLDKAAVVIMRD